MDHILFFKPVGASTSVITHQGDKFVVVWQPKSGLPGNFPHDKEFGGKVGYEVFKNMGFVMDYNSSGCLDHVGLFDTAEGRIWLMTCPNSDGNWDIVYRQDSRGIGPWNVKGGINDRCFAFDYDSSGCNDHILAYTRHHGNIWILKRANHQPGPNKLLGQTQRPSVWPPQVIPPDPQIQFAKVFETQSGVAGHTLASPHDSCLTYDYNHTGKRDHLCLFTPGEGLMTIVTNDGNNSLKAVYGQKGIGGYDLMSTADRVFAFDYDHTGMLDHLCLYRPRAGLFWIMKNTEGSFTPVYPTGQPSMNNAAGIAGYHLKASIDLAFAFDYEQSGKQDYVTVYSPGQGTIIFVKHDGDTLSIIQQSQGLPGSDLKSTQDRMFAYDYDHSGKLDHLVVIRPGSEIVNILKNTGGKFSIIYRQHGPSQRDIKYQNTWIAPIGGFDLASTKDQAIAYDLNSTGSMDHIVFYRPGEGILYIVQNLMGGFSPAYQGFSAGLGSFRKELPSHTPLHIADGHGLPGFDFKSTMDQCIAFDFSSSGCSDHIVAFRPGQRMLGIYRPVSAIDISVLSMCSFNDYL